MLITPLGFLLIPLGIILLFFKTKFLLYAIVITSVFFNTSIINSPFLMERIQPVYYFLMLLIIKRLFLLIKNNKILIYQKIEYSLLIFFVFVSFISLLMPLLLQNEIRVLGFDQSSFGAINKLPYKEISIPLQLRRTNFTQLLYLLFVSLSYFFINLEIKDKNEIIKITNLYIYSGVFITLQGLFYQFAVMTNKYSLYDYINYFLKGEFIPFNGKMMTNSIPRMYTIVGEPGYTASFLLLPIIILFVDIFTHSKSSSIKKYILFFLLLTGLFFSSSTTGYLGLFVLFISYVLLNLIKLYNKYNIINLLNLIKFSAIIFVVIIIFSILIKNPINYLIFNHLDKLKLQSGSGMVRFLHAKTSFDIFLKSPILGVGYGSHRSPSAIMTLLANTGLIGTTLFILFNVCSIRKALILKKYINNNFLKNNLYSFGLVALVYLILMIFAKSISFILFLFYWINLALITSTYKIYKGDYSNENSHRHHSYK
ncbi:MAG: O-antigen ligase family protein [archaeon]